MTPEVRRIRDEIDRLEHLRQAGPCNLPAPTSTSWTDPVWLDLWLRNNPHVIDQQQTALVRTLARTNQRKANR